MHARQPHRTRRAFTLIELLVVISIIVVLASIAVIVAPRMQQSQKAGRGADQLSSWLLITKSKTPRDRAATGLRFIVDANNFVSEVQYVQQPDPFTVRPGVALNPITGQLLPIRRLNLVGNNNLGAGLEAPGQGVQPPFSDFTGGQQAQTDYPVQPGDYLELKGGGFVHQITAVGPTSLVLNSPGPTIDFPGTDQYRILRQPRRLAGEESLFLPQDVVIDFSIDPNTNLPRSRNVPVRTINNQTFYEVLFSPAGGVVGKGTSSNDKIILWVRDATQDSPTDGEPALVTIHIRTGMIAIHPVDLTPGGDPYSFTRDPRNSGM
jgi:prepilin-type N-terminal cleavage/methylation domain-containing protein